MIFLLANLLQLNATDYAIPSHNVWAKRKYPYHRALFCGFRKAKYLQHTICYIYSTAEILKTENDRRDPAPDQHVTP